MVVGSMLLIAVLVFVTIHFEKPPEHPVPVIDVGPFKHDCHPDQNSDKEEMRTNCLKRGCHWDSHVANNTPACFYPDDFANYEYSLSSRGDQDFEIILRKTETPSGFTDDMASVRVTIEGISDQVVQVKVEKFVAQAESYDRWKPPIPHLQLTKTVKKPLYDIQIVKEKLTIVRKNTDSLIFQTDFKKLIFADHFIQLIVKVDGDSLYGFGERLSRHKKSFPKTLPNDRIRLPFMNTGRCKTDTSYGSHPFYLMYEKDNLAHGVQLINSNPSDVTLTAESSLVYRTIGGDLNFLIFLGQNTQNVPDAPIDVLRQKSHIMGRTQMPPYWALGFHLCRWGFKSDDHMRQTFEANTQAGIPIDTMWADIDYMDNFNMFTVDNVSFSGLSQLVQDLHRENRHFVPILDPSISPIEPVGSPAYEVFKRGLDQDVYIKDASGNIIYSRIWQNTSVLPDFTHPNVCSWWAAELRRMHEQLPFDGLWIDMNEPETRLYASGGEEDCFGKTGDPLDNPQYNPVYPRKVEDFTICMSSQHDLGPHNDIHNMYSIFESLHTYLALKNLMPGKRPFILSRATTSGQGMYSNHWTGDVDSSWQHMRSSIPSILDFNLFAIPLVGSDICGFFLNTTEELCARWSSLGAFYPFSRNHNVDYAIPQDPASMGGNVLTAAKKALNIRYELLPYIYTLFFDNHMHGTPVARSLKMNFPNDERIAAIEDQFMLGDSVLISPVLFPDTTDIGPFFPPGIWFDYTSQQVVSNSSTGGIIDIHVPITDISVTLRGGSIIAVKPGINKTTHDHFIMPFELITILDQDKKASGSLFWDDGDGSNNTETGEYNFVTFEVRGNELVSEILALHESGGNMNVTRLNIWNIDDVEKVSIKTFDPTTTTECVKQYSQEKRILTVILPDDTSLRKSFSVSWE